MRTTTMDEWTAEGIRLFGEDQLRWRFKCPSCGHVAAAADWKAAGAPPNAVAFSCLGRWAAGTPLEAFAEGQGPCNYAGGGLIGYNPVSIEGRGSPVFEFAPPVATQGEL